MLPDDDADVVILGAGVAGLAAAQRLVDAQYNVLIVEARDSVGGRIRTVHDSVSAMPIELGAEFVHGKPPASLKIIETAGLPLLELSGDRWCSENGKLGVCQDFYEELDRVFKKMTERGRDGSFLEFLNDEAAAVPEEIRRHALRYIEGFEAARPERISVQALARENKTSEAIEGDRAFRITSGYDSLLNAMMADMDADRCKLHLNTVAKAVKWSDGAVEIETDQQTFRARGAVITLPLSVLQHGSVRFSPSLSSKTQALAHLEMGSVMRVTMRFRERFWEQIKVDGRSLGNLSFLLSDRPLFPTWWSTMPKMTPMLTGWSAGPHGLALSGRSDEEVIACAMESLAAIFHIEESVVQDMTEATFFHNWQRDPFSQGAYSYPCVGGIDAGRELSRSVGRTLFFAGEATDQSGRNGTVDGAIESGKRAAGEILEAMQG